MTTRPADETPHGKHPSLRVRGAAPFNGGPPQELLGAQMITPTELFFSRNHGAVPAVDATLWRLRIGGLVRQPMELSLGELQRKFAHHTVAATLVCAGLRRDELTSVREIRGELPWGLEPVSTGSFGGVALKDLLLAASPMDGAAHVGFLGLDAVERKQRTFGFGGSIPLAKALADEVLLAFEMNGAPLPAVHGGPVRVIVPGYIGARSVKWLGEIEVRAEPSDNYFQAEAYRVLREVRGGDARDVTAGEALAEVPLNAVILSPAAGSVRSSRPVEVTGWACGTGCRRPGRVEVSGDGGATWTDAVLEKSAGEWTWVLWRASVVVASGAQTLVARAWEPDGSGQPETLAEVWNVKGYANNAWHRVPIEVKG